jgi:Spy/CpxP family protein refolding chaperone
MAVYPIFTVLELNMKSIRNSLWAALMAAGAVVAASGMSAASAADDATTPPPGAPGPHGWHHHRGGEWHLLGKLGLSDAQKQQIKSILTAARPEMESLHSQIRANQLKLRQTQPSDPNYTSIVSQASQTHGSLSAQVLTQRAQVRAQVFQVLTPAQQTQLAALEAQFEAKIQAHKQGASGGSQNP